MTQPTADQELDQLIINAGRELAQLHLDSADPELIEAARAALIAARQARYPNG